MNKVRPRQIPGMTGPGGLIDVPAKGSTLRYEQDGHRSRHRSHFSMPRYRIYVHPVTCRIR